MTKKGTRNDSFHAYVELSSKEKAGIKIVPASEVSKKERNVKHMEMKSRVFP